jgi:hypothetical protein
MKKEHENLKHKVITMLDRKEVEFLDKLGKDALFSTGHKLSYNDILKGLVELAIQAGLDAENVDSTEKLEEKMYQKMRESLARLKCKER